MGRLSNFAWRNLSFSRHSKSMGARIFNDGALFRLAEAFAMTEVASKKGGAPEYQATYVGATYDGADVDDDLLVTEAGAVDVPDTGLVQSLMDGVEGLSELAKDLAIHRKNDDTMIMCVCNVKVTVGSNAHARRFTRLDQRHFKL